MLAHRELGNHLKNIVYAFSELQCLCHFAKHLDVEACTRAGPPMSGQTSWDGMKNNENPKA